MEANATWHTWRVSNVGTPAMDQVDHTAFFWADASRVKGSVCARKCPCSAGQHSWYNVFVLNHSDSPVLHKAITTSRARVLLSFACTRTGSLCISSKQSGGEPLSAAAASWMSPPLPHSRSDPSSACTPMPVWLRRPPGSSRGASRRWARDSKHFAAEPRARFIPSGPNQRIRRGECGLLRAATWHTTTLWPLSYSFPPKGDFMVRVFQSVCVHQPVTLFTGLLCQILSSIQVEQKNRKPSPSVRLAVGYIPPCRVNVCCWLSGGLIVYLLSNNRDRGKYSGLSIGQEGNTETDINDKCNRSDWGRS